MAKPTRSERSVAATLQGNQRPTLSVVPAFAETDLTSCLDTCSVGGLEPLPWQKGLLEGWLGRTEHGRWSAMTAALAVPRQNGKTLGVTLARLGYGMLILGEEVIYTAHLQKTATETFEDMRDFFSHRKLKKHVKYIRSALGREEIGLKNGARVKFLARTRNGGRGQHGDVLVFDEAQELTDKQQGSFLPAISARPNPQTIYLGTPPDEKTDGAAFSRIRRRALEGDSSHTSWAEWSTDEIGDVSDRERWKASNPSFGILINEDVIEGELDTMAVDEFARERLGWWEVRTEKSLRIFDMGDWEECECVDAPEGKMGFGVKFAPDGESVSLSVAIVSGECDPYVELIESADTFHGTSWLTELLAARWEDAASIVVDGRAYAQQLADELVRRGVPKRMVRVPKAADAVSAAAGFLNAVRERAICHIGQDELTESVANAAKRPIGSDGGWGFKDADGGDSSPVESAAIALWGVMNTKRDPTREQRLL